MSPSSGRDARGEAGAPSKTVEELFHAALEREPSERAAFLEDACGGDEALLREVTSLLEADERAERFIEQPAADAATQAVAAGTGGAPFSPGAKLGHFEIVSLIGAGGMGDVYRAEDTQLGRQVALKVLRPELAASPERRKRFEREARALAALSHPHIVTVFSVEQAEGVDFLTMELVKGKSLSRLIPKGGLSLGEFLALSIPLADAVAAAHAHGITHRDLKPDNVMVDHEGRVKVLDFGLVKLKQELLGTIGSQLPTATGTAEGRIVGTVAYMSPEQAEGRAVDPRSDVFSLGVVLYEMATGERPFRGESASALLASILKDTPVSVTDLRPELPRALGRILKRALHKDPEERIQTAKELRNELRELKAEVDSGEAWEKPAEGLPWPRKWAALGGLAVMALVLGMGVWIFVSREPAPGPLTVTPITSDAAVEWEPALSPDGKLLVFTRRDDEGGGLYVKQIGAGLYVKQIGGGEPLRIAHGRGMWGSAWSPDGSRIAFVRHPGGEAPAGISIIPALGGPEQQVATTHARVPGLSWSPDGRLLALTDRDPSEENPRDHIALLTLDTGEKRRLTTPPPGYLGGELVPRFSPDGRTLAFLGGRPALWDVYLVSVEGGEPRRLTSGALVDGLDWAPDGRSLIVSSKLSPRAGVSSLSRLSVSSGELEPLGFGEDGDDPTVARQAGRLAYLKETRQYEIWRLGGLAAEEHERSPVPFLPSRAWDFSGPYSPDGRLIAFTSMRSGFGEVWVADAEGSNLRQLTSLRYHATGFPQWSPDGRHIAFSSVKEGTYDVYVVPVAGGVPRRITGDPFRRWVVSWSRDGRWIYFQSNRTGRHEIWKMPAEGGEGTQVTRAGGDYLCEGPDGRLLYFTKPEPGGPSGLWRMPADGGEETQLLADVVRTNFAVVERGIYYIRRGTEPGPSLEFYDFSTGQTRPVAVPEPAPDSDSGLFVSPDERWIVYTTSRFETDIMLVDSFR